MATTITAPGKGTRHREPITALQVADWLRDGIRGSRLVPGQRLVEADITRATGASRTKVREALQRLESEGLVLIEEFKGASVRRITFEEVEQIYRARVALEGISARDFAERASDSDMQALKDVMESLEIAVAAGAHDDFNRYNTDWHRLLVEGSGNAIIGDLLSRLNVPIQRLLFESFYNADRLQEANSGHRAVMAAMAKRDGVKAEAAMRRHIEDAFSTLTVIETEFRSMAPELL